MKETFVGQFLKCNSILSADMANIVLLLPIINFVLSADMANIVLLLVIINVCSLCRHDQHCFAVSDYHVSVFCDRRHAVQRHRAHVFWKFIQLYLFCFNIMLICCSAKIQSLAPLHT